MRASCRMETAWWVVLCWLTSLGVSLSAERQLMSPMDRSATNLLKAVQRKPYDSFSDDVTDHESREDQQRSSVYLPVISKLNGREFTLFLSVNEENTALNWTVFGVYNVNKTLPFLEFTTYSASGESRVFSVRYQGRKSYQRTTFSVPRVTFERLMLWVNTASIGLVIDCGTEMVKPLAQHIAAIPPFSTISLGHDREGSDKFEGMLLQAKLYPRELDVRPWTCDQDEDLQADEHPTQLGEERISILENQVSQLLTMVNMLKTQNKDLVRRVDQLETCECHPMCSFSGVVYQEEETWQPDNCTRCICRNGKPHCSRNQDLPECSAPCLGAPCQHGGTCRAESGGDNFACDCPKPFDGQACAIRINPIVFPQDRGRCNQTMTRFYYDRFTQICLPFNYTGCGGNLNNYKTLEECESVSLTGACCYRRFLTSVSAIMNGQERGVEQKCEMLTMDKCKGLHGLQWEGMETEVVSFYPGLDCDEARCFTPSGGCHVNGQTYKKGEVIQYRCQECTCQSSGLISCQCNKPTQRKEIRDMSREDLVRFQKGVTALRHSGVWEELRDLYIRHSMHCHGRPNFLPWNRLFLHNMETKLQELDCDISLPYYDFTTDVGNFENAVIWQPNYFGGNGEGPMSCVPDHPFGDRKAWKPCLSRNFNTSVKLPSVAEIALALKTEDFNEMSISLEAFTAYLHTFVGGDMMWTGAPYDPVFYIIHAYTDQLYWTWQQQHQANKYKFPAVFGNLPMLPYEVAPKDVLDSEQALCVTYAEISKGHECNITLTPPSQESSAFVEEANAYDMFGYDRNGFDRRGFDRNGVQKNGYNRDGFDRQGYDRAGFDRLGFNIDGYDTTGFNHLGRDKDGNGDTSGRYEEEGHHTPCRQRSGVDSEGFDQYGFSLDGYDVNYCNFSYQGPFSPIQSFNVWHTLLHQTPTFIKTLPRICPGIEPLPEQWFDLHWITSPYDVTGLVKDEAPTLAQSQPATQFCMDTGSLGNSCPCIQALASCTHNPCLTTDCPAYPEATCTVSFCGECQPRWSLEGVSVDCHKPRDYCIPNPCQHGGVCFPSEWPSDPQLITCQCAPGYDGPLCQHPALDVCELPVSLGKCRENLTRWYFNPQTSLCQEFIYTGCRGNANNFLSFKACRNRCMIGACCSRSSRMPGHIHGYDLQGYDRYGYNYLGLDEDGNMRSVDVATGSGEKRYDSHGFDWRGFDRNGFDFEGLDHHGFNKDGFSRDGFNRSGLNQFGEFDGIIDYNENGFDREGFDRAGFNRYGFNRDDVDYEGLVGGYRYECRHTTLQQCQELEEDIGQVVQFSPGRTCDQVGCHNKAGCDHYNRTPVFEERFTSGCQQCTCTRRGVVECQCSVIQPRKEVRDTPRLELERFQNAVKSLTEGYHSKWYKLSELYAMYKPQFSGTPNFLPWNRYFLRTVEHALQSVDCDVTIPYFDWTMDVGAMEKSAVWAANVFGTNGHSVNGCVRHHPFKEKFPPFWTPCLRRRFNSTVNLLDAVDLEQILRETSYEQFRLHMELMSGLFQTWGGGHMITDMAPYDPAFLSHLAFIDKVWTDWQKRNLDHPFKFPVEHRYTLLPPFAVSPDDVMDCEKQMCVRFIPIGQGIPCNSSIPKFGYDKKGFNRHGFDREGFDERGYNKSGYSRDGKFDTGNFYDTHGYSKQGFSRHGYDESGLDRYGFTVTTFNLDGFDSDGFDQSGYNRYGFDRNGRTPFGFHSNNTDLTDLNVIRNQIFDPFGYNRYGFDKFGYDRQGYDVFGFNSAGFNKYKCRRYFLGPMYLIIKSLINQKLKSLDDKELQLLVRVCPGTSKIPEWIYTRNWLKRGNQIPLSLDIETSRRLRRVQSEEPLKKSSVNGENIWVPEPPDRRFCFVTYQYSECPLGQAPVTCSEELCEERTCPGHPQAGCWTRGCRKCYPDYYDGISGKTVNCTGCIDNEGRMRDEDTTWQTSECRVCQCQRGNVGCQRIDCPSVQCRHPVKVKGQCCPSCDAGCFYKDKVYKENETVTSGSAMCHECTCSQGNMTCDRKICPDIHNCLNPSKVDGECCPVCMECEGHKEGEQWKQTPCLTCTCTNGQKMCTKPVCPELPCAHPFTPEGECCPVCVGCFYGDVIYQDGEEFQPDACAICRCNQGDVECTTKTCPPIRCDNPIQPPGLCCPVCDAACSYEGSIYHHTEQFTPSYNPCMNCSCTNSLVRCVTIKCSAKLTCQRPIKLPGHCCATECPKCIHNGHQYEHGEIWTPDETDCQMCECRDGLVSCRVQQVCGLECTHGVVVKGQCCSACTDCLYDGRVIPNGRYFSRPGDACQQCMCRHGNIQCEVVDVCPRLPCSKTQSVAGTCCPICKGCHHEGRFYRHSAMVSAPNVCTDCTCVEGDVECTPKPCPAINCNNPQVLEGECCPVCTHCLYNQVVYEDGQTFTPGRNPCYRCTCSGGQVDCRESTQCETPQCSHPARVAGQCCPVCEHCDFERRRFRNGQMFMPPTGDPCQVCTCKAGSVLCEKIQCAPVNCANSYVPSGHCCETCPPACRFQGTDYPDGLEFDDPRDKCSLCGCKSGVVICQPKACPELTCTHPARGPGECCPSCNFCVHDRRLFRNGHTFRHPTDKCQDCVCEDGSVRCQPSPCPPVPCPDPVTEPGKCCPFCVPDTCEFQGQQFQQGQRFPSQRDPCEECVCDRGRVSCQRTPCSTVPCSHPLNGDCCPSCDGCLFLGRALENGQILRNPYSRCEDCTCTGGNVTCVPRACPPAPCQHPATLDCCPSCRQCRYLGRQYHNGQKFSDGSGPCRECVCQNGTVTCGEVTCGANLPCQNPAKGDCCLECNDCEFFDQRYRNGLAFPEPTNECKVCLCRDGNVDCQDKTCPRVACRHPVQGKCCPECTDCLYGDVRYEEGQTFPDMTDTCNDCVCRAGDVRCSARQCPNALCTHPVRSGCCEECTDCSYLQEVYENEVRFDDQRNPCQTCQCLQGNIRCEAAPCPPAPCEHPVQGRCCPECKNCLYLNREYLDQQVIPHQDDPCTYCQCNQGTVDCQPKMCAEPTCQHPVKGLCCPECEGCLYNQVEYSNQQSFTDQEDPCKVCQCRNGDVMCRQRQCGRVTCRHPVQGKCCRECEDCFYEGVQRRNTAVFRDSQDPCKVCQCVRGNVVCRQRICPTPTCLHPVQGQCCPECNKCEFEGKQYDDGQGFSESGGGCRDCRCSRGTMTCRSPQCPPVTCRHPVQGACCRECDACRYDGQVYDNGQRFEDPADICKNCDCVDGTVRCQNKPCPVMTCRHPVKIDCCHECSDCLYENRTIRSGTEFPGYTDPCTLCTCLRGTVSCRRKECPVTYCTHPVQGPCCLQCGGQCLYQGQVLDSGQSIKKDCQTCLCVKGNVQCERSYCPMLPCLHPVTLPDQCCPECSHCFYNGRRFVNGQSFSDVRSPCKECKCQDGTVTCSKRPCPSVSCQHPVQGECCPECGTDCLFKGRRLAQGSTFPSAEDRCQSCTCGGGTVVCEAKRCDPAPCRHPAQDECGCGQCEECSFLQTSVDNGQQFTHPSDTCQKCRCQSGNVACEAVTCDVTCTHPASTDHCCPVCDRCLYEGEMYDTDQQFVAAQDPCMACSCKSGSVSCQRTVCLEPRCANPVRREGQCCFECPVCRFYEQQYKDGESFSHPEDQCKRCTCSGGRVSCGREACVTECTHPRPGPCCPSCEECYFEGQLVGNGQTFRPDPCKTCFCTNGDVVCEDKQCPQLDCLKTVTDQGECCPKCSGCMYEGVHYEEASNWIPTDNTCVSCMCSGGIITCDELSCLTMCDHPISMPGQCCPVCPTCKYNGASYEDGDEFNPNGDPCDICKCMKGHLRCIHETCPNVNHCPSEQIVPAKPGVCCPTCSGFGTNCTRDHLGMKLTPRADDPCFVCECQESFNWICTKESCEALACPASEQKPVPGQCCPQCPVCYVRRTGQYYHEGEEWQDEDNPCIVCACKEGSVQCSIVDCPVVQCGAGEELVKPAGRCCEECSKSRQLKCLHHGKVYQADEEWRADECTSCVCRGGKAVCTAQQCSPLDCPSDEIPSLAPGSCCPVCLAKPASCIVFGDPHYKTFDGTTYHFQGTCQYIMATDCEGGDFTVEVHHDDRGVEEKVSWAQNLTVKLADFRVDLLQNHIVRAGGREVTLPYFQEPHFYVERSENTILLNTNLGVKLSWDGSSTAELSVPGTYKRRTCGLCGNFNGFPQDDMKMKSGKITNSPAVFGNSWKVNSQCGDAEDIDPCAKAGYRAKKIANVKCAVIKSDLFARCHRVISPEPYFSSCVFDMCVCSEEADCLCNILASYAHECAKAGVRLQWRSSALCAISCPVDRGFIFDECGPPCPRTCENRNTPLGNIEAYCFKPCIPGCQCVAGKVVHDGKCIDPANCPS